MPDYKTNDPKGWCGDPSRGAALGRHDRHASADFKGELTLRRVHIDQQGYDDNGTYFGTGDPLYWYASEDGTIDACTRAKSREGAMRIVRERYPSATFAAPEVIDPVFLSAYIECALWSSTDDEDQPLDSNYSEADLAPETLEKMRADCEKFQRDNAELLARAYALGDDAEHAGHDFWLTRNGNGAGFWDRYLDFKGEAREAYKPIGDKLTEASEKFGEVYLSVGDDGLIYQD